MTASTLAVVTGSTRGIGEAVARNLAAANHKVVVTGRDRALGAKVAGDVGGTFHELDLADADSIATFAASLESPLKVLVNNAGASFDGFNAEVARRTLDVNFVATMKLTDRLLPSSFADDARIVMVSSGMGEVNCLSEPLQREVMSPKLDRAGLVAFVDRFVEDVGAGTYRKKGWPSNAYSVSKVAMNAYVRILARELQGDARRILVNAACPGWVRTAMGGKHAPRSVEEGAKTPTWLALLPPGDERTGGFFRDEQPIDW